jgi:rSAM/selenodomain-associated transferase 1
MGLDLVSRFQEQEAFELKIFYSPAGSEGEMRSWLGDRLDFLPQKGEDLGQRMCAAFEWAFRREYGKVLVIGCDAPDVECSVVLNAFSRLDDFDVVLGPSTDGGYYLMGLKQLRDDLFEDISWSTNQVLNQTKERIDSAGLSSFSLPTRDDVDTYSDVLKLRSKFEDSINRELKADLSNTFRVINEIVIRV